MHTFKVRLKSYYEYLKNVFMAKIVYRLFRYDSFLPCFGTIVYKRIARRYLVPILFCSPMPQNEYEISLAQNGDIFSFMMSLDACKYDEN